MTNSKTTPSLSLSRRDLLRGASATAGAYAASQVLGGSRIARADDKRPPKFLIVLGASGGASVIDGPMAIRATESKNARTVNCYEDANVTTALGDLRAVKHVAPSVGPIPYAIDIDQASFIRKYGVDMQVVTATTTSVNHSVAQRRSVTGNEAWRGRTLQELVALEYGSGLALPNVHLSTGSEFTARGTDGSLPAYAFGETIADPLLWPLSTHGSRGIAGANQDMVARARTLRDDKLRKASQFSRIFDGAPNLKKWRALRAGQEQFEKADLITKLMLAAEGDAYPLRNAGLSEAPVAAGVRAKFPNFERDPLEAQAAMAFLMITQGVSVTATISASFGFVYTGKPGSADEPLEAGGVKNLPIAFDFSHTSHRAAQAFMWERMYRTAGSLIDLLKATEYAGGESYWDRAMIYIPTDFGRTKVRPEDAPDFGSGHDLNNGFVMLSPMLKGGRVLGGVDPDSGMTYGFSLATGAPEKGRTTSEKEVFGGILNTLGVTTTGSGLPDVPAMRR
jgi:hypothetical protein